MYLKKLTVKKRELLDIARVGLPSGILSSFFSIANVLIQSSVNSFGYLVMAGNSTGSSLESYVYTSMNAVSSSATTFAGQNYGAKKYHRIKQILWDCSLLTVLISIVLGGIILIFARPLCRIFTNDPLVIGYAVDRMTIILPIYFVCGIVEVIVGCLRGMNRAVVPMIPSFVCVCAYRIIWIYTAFRAQSTTTMLYLSYPISWVLNLIIDAVLFEVYFRRLILPPKHVRALMKSEEYLYITPMDAPQTPQIETNCIDEENFAQNACAQAKNDVT